MFSANYIDLSKKHGCGTLLICIKLQERIASYILHFCFADGLWTMNIY